MFYLALFVLAYSQWTSTRARFNGGIWIASPLYLAILCRVIRTNSGCSSGLIAPIMAVWIMIWSLCSWAIMVDAYCNIWASHSTSSKDVPNNRIVVNPCVVGSNTSSPNTSLGVIKEDFLFPRQLVSVGSTRISCSICCTECGGDCCSSTCCLFAACISSSVCWNLWLFCFVRGDCGLFLASGFRFDSWIGWVWEDGSWTGCDWGFEVDSYSY